MTYAIQKLNLRKVAMYIDAGHAGWLGWQANLQPAADLYASIYKGAGSPAAGRGLATNVANYYAWSISSCSSYTQGNSNCDEKRYINALHTPTACASKVDWKQVLPIYNPSSIWSTTFSPDHADQSLHV